MQLHNGDAYELIKTIPDKSVDLIVTDPPYLYKLSQTEDKDCHYANDANALRASLANMSSGFDYSILDEFMRVMKRPNIYIWCSNFQLTDLLYYFQQRKCITNVIVWCKPNAIPFCNGKYIDDVEYCVFAKEQGVQLYGNNDTKHKHYIIPINHEDKKLYHHPTIKPLLIIKNFIINSSKEGDIVLDPFMGSGTTGAAAKILNRDFIGFEMEKEYFDIAKARIEKTTKQNQKPILDLDVDKIGETVPFANSPVVLDEKQIKLRNSIMKSRNEIIKRQNNSRKIMNYKYR